MIKITSFHTNHLRNDLHFQFFIEFRDLVIEANPEELHVKPQFDGFLVYFAREDEALKKIPASAFTPKIRAADAERDEMLTGMAELVNAMCKHYDPSIRDAALRLKVVFNTYKHTASKAINEETSAIYNLIQELRSPTYAADVTLVGIAGWVGETERRNNKVEALVKSRYTENAAKTDVVLREQRLKVDDAYKDICDIINARVLIEGPAAYETFVRTLNEVIKKYAAAKHHHRKGKKGADEEETPEGEETGAEEEA